MTFLYRAECDSDQVHWLCFIHEAIVKYTSNDVILSLSKEFNLFCYEVLWFSLTQKRPTIALKYCFEYFVIRSCDYKCWQTFYGNILAHVTVKFFWDTLQHTLKQCDS